MTQPDVSYSHVLECIELTIANAGHYYVFAEGAAERAANRAVATFAELPKPTNKAKFFDVLSSCLKVEIVNQANGWAA